MSDGAPRPFQTVLVRILCQRLNGVRHKTCFDAFILKKWKKKQQKKRKIMMIALWCEQNTK